MVSFEVHRYSVVGKTVIFDAIKYPNIIQVGKGFHLSKDYVVILSTFLFLADKRDQYYDLGFVFVIISYPLNLKYREDKKIKASRIVKIRTLFLKKVSLLLQ